MFDRFLACDLGAESGRLMLGTLSGKLIELEEIHRFPNVPLKRDGSLLWNLESIFDEIKIGMAMVSSIGEEVVGISVDSWGVDYVLLDADGELISPAFHYRDSRNKASSKAVLKRLEWKEIYEETGLQFINFNTLFQLAAETPERLTRASKVLPLADGFNHLLSGVPKAEASLASTTQLYDPRKRAWSSRLAELAGLRVDQLPDIVSSGTPLGPLRREIAEKTGFGNATVVAGLSHDTAAAVAATPVEGEGWAFLSSGTWSLIGMELDEPLINEQTREMNFTNEIGYGHSVRFLKNVIGLWLLQECRRRWAEKGDDLGYDELCHLAGLAEPFACLIDPDDMPAEIAGFCRETGQTEPADPGAYARCCFESLALVYRRRVDELPELTGRPVDRVHVLGGGSRNDLLNQFTANALAIPVAAGPAEATALGNVAVQAIALSRLPDLATARSIIAVSFPPRIFLPEQKETWATANDRFSQLCRTS